jgi:hypothetical protein
MKKCPEASKILGLSIINDFIGSIDMKFFSSEIKNDDMIIAIQYLKHAYLENNKDFDVLSGLTLAYYLLNQMPYYTKDDEKKDFFDKEHTRLFSMLERYSAENSYAKRCYQMYNDLQMNIAILIIQNLHPDVSISVE